MNIGVIMVRHPATRHSPLMPEVVRLLQAWGATVDILYPHEQLMQLSQLRVGYDVYVLKAKTNLVLSLAGALHGAGATMLNSYPITALMRDKVMTMHVLQRAGIP